mgnify:CR=1 FL=1
MNPSEQKSHKKVTADLAAGIEALAATTAERCSTLSEMINTERTLRLKMAEEQRGYVDNEDRLLRRYAEQCVEAAHKRLDKFVRRGFWSRLNWLLTGR